jgi:hypothetical protein
MPFKAKKFKQKIGTKTDADEVKVVKRFTNGHKTFTSLEARRMTEQQTRERITAEVFDKNILSLTRPRNPLSGEETPREGNVYKERKVLPFPLIPKNRPPAGEVREPKAVTLKVGQFEEQAKPSPEEILLADEPKHMARIDSLQKIRDNVKAELLYYQSKVEERKQKINSNLVTNYLTSQRLAGPTMIKR